MPYFIYKVTEFPIRQLEKLGRHDAYRDASNRAKQLRGELPGDAACVIKVMFAETEFDAEDLLNQVRVAAPEPGDD
ncbi:MAG: hypothetical protein HY938_09755 [Nitrosomonadales bacterium]|nr:hypothetical protein [Nitrosomonadales bacterium]